MDDGQESVVVGKDGMKKAGLMVGPGASLPPQVGG